MRVTDRFARQTRTSQTGVLDKLLFFFVSGGHFNVLCETPRSQIVINVRKYGNPGLDKDERKRREREEEKDLVTETK